MLYFLMTDFRDIAPVSALLSAVSTFVLAMIYLAYVGSSIRRSAEVNRPPRSLSVLGWIMRITLSLTVLSVYVLLAEDFALQRSRAQIALPAPLEMLIGAPPHLDSRRLLLSGILLLGLILLTNILVFAQLKQGSGLRLWLDRFRSIKRPQEAHGSAHFATAQEYRRFRVPEADGMQLYGKFFGQRTAANRFTYLGDTFCLDAEDSARGMLALGNPGSGKSSSMILPAIYGAMLAEQHLIVADPQSELTPHILRYARASGHRVVLHDPTHPKSPRFNLAEGVSNVSDARALADVLIPSSSGGAEQFWSQSAAMLLAACLLRFDSLGEIFASLTDLKRLADTLNNQPDDAQRLAGSFINSVQLDGKLATNIVATLSTHLAAWADAEVCDSTCASEFDARLLLHPHKPAVIVLACRGRYRRVIAPYLGAVLTRLLRDLDSYGEQQNDGALPRPVHIVLDEFPALGNLSAVVEYANLIRKRRISLLVAAQTLGQLEALYGKSGLETLLSGMAFQVVFGGCDARTAQHYSQVAGQSTEKDAQNLEHTRGRSLLTADEMVRPPQGNCTIFGRYVTSEYATYVIVLARLTRIYERDDVRYLVADSANKSLQLLRRQKRKLLPVPTRSLAKPFCSRDVLEMSS